MGPKTQDICYATENRQLAVKAVAPLVPGAAGGGFAKQFEFAALVEVCEKSGVPAYLLDDRARCSRKCWRV